MSSLCLTAGVLGASVFAQAFHLAWTPADGIPRESSWNVANTRIEHVADRVSRTATKAPPGAPLIEGWYHVWPGPAVRQRIVLDRKTLERDYVLCGHGWCTPLEQLLPRAQAPVVEIRLCTAVASQTSRSG